MKLHGFFHPSKYLHLKPVKAQLEHLGELFQFHLKEQPRKAFSSFEQLENSHHAHHLQSILRHRQGLQTHSNQDVQYYFHH